MAYGSAVDDYVALAALVAFDGVDSDGFGALDAEGGQFVGNHGNLVAEGDDDAYPAGSIEGESILLAEGIDGLYEAGCYVGFVAVDFVGVLGGGIGGVDKADASGGYQALVCIVGADGVVVVLPPQAINRLSDSRVIAISDFLIMRLINIQHSSPY